MHGGLKKTELANENINALEKGLPNLFKHVENIKAFGLPVVVAVNNFPTDTANEIKFLQDKLNSLNIPCALAEVWAKGGEGGKLLAEKIVKACEEKSDFKFTYEADQSPEDKIEAIAKKIYGADGVDYAPAALKDLQKIHDMGLDKLLVCMAKTQYSLSDNAELICRPEHFRVLVREIRISAGAGFIVAITGNIMTMPGLPKKPAALNIDVDDDGKITGLF